MKLARAVRMRPADLADRVRQEQLKVLERLHLVGTGEIGPHTLSLERFRAFARERFFAGATHANTAAWIAAQLPATRERVLAAADDALAGRFDLLGYRQLELGEAIDWMRDPITGTRLKREHWTKIDPLDRAAVGDHKGVWELNRQQWLLSWAQAYVFTRDERYAQRAVAAIEHWLRSNPPGVGINWVSSLELAFRLIAWCWTLVLLRESPALERGAFERVLEAVHAHATHIARYLSTTYSPNTHLLGEALGLFYAGVLFPEIDRGSSWRTTGRRVLVEQLQAQILPDGVCFEQSTCYQRYTAEMALHFLVLADRNRLPVPPEVSERAQRCVEFLLALSRPDGSAPQIGDGDGGWLLPLVPRAPEDMRAVFGAAAVQFDRGDYADAAGGPVPEAAWLFGPDALREPSTVVPIVSRASASQLFADGGYAVLASQRSDGSHKLVLDVGPLGCPYSAAHGHADLLSLTCDAFGVPFIVDPGMPTYGGDPAWRDAFRGTGMHSTLTVDQLPQAEPAGMFSWRQRPRVTVRGWSSDDSVDSIDAEHDAYASRCNGLVHRRRVLFFKPRYWVIVDDLRDAGGGARRRVELNFQLAAQHTVTLAEPWVRIAAPTGQGLLLRTLSDPQPHAAVRTGELGCGPLRGWVSPAYGRAEAAPALSYSVTTALPFRAVTWLVPVERWDASLPDALLAERDHAVLQTLIL